MPTKAYFIGLGGCGLKTVSDLQRRLCPTGEFSEYKFTYVDTDDATVTKINEHGIIIRPGDLINVGDTNPFQVYKNASGGRTKREKRFMEWVIAQDNTDASKAKFTLPNNFLADGARGQRMIGRTAVHHRYDDIYRELAGKIDTFFEHDSHNAKNQIPQVWVVASSCGGTGSSMTMDVLYMLDKIVNDKCQSSPELKLVLFMPKPFIDANHGNPDYPLNAFSYMWELNAFRLDFQQNVHDRFYNFSVDPSGPTGRPFPLYKFVIPVDVETSFGTKIPLDSLYPTVAELIYYCNKGQAAQEMISAISNDQNQLLAALTENDRTPFKWTRSLVPYGYRVIKKANDEFKKYMSTRALYEVLKYGVLGLGLPEDPIIRDKVKQEFAKDYILKYLCDIPSVGVTAGESSLQADVAEIFAGVRVSPTNLDKQRILYTLNAIDDLSKELKGVSSTSQKRVEEAIDKGVQKSILENGLRYTKDLLNNVDDFYLETVILPALRTELADVAEAQNSKRSECDAMIAGFKEKQAPAAAKLLGEYRELTQRYHVLSLTITLIDSGLTAHPSGYLEVIRKGDLSCSGLQNIIVKVETAVTNAYDDYISLAKAFIETGKDALTEYLPKLDVIAKGQNDTYWAKDSLFDIMYHDSIIAYDHEHERESRERIPVRKNTGDNNLWAFVESVCNSDNSILKLAKDKDRFHFERNFTEWIMKPLLKKISEAVGRDGMASKWLQLTLEDSLDAENMLPKGMTRDEFLVSMSNRDRIPVLYPMVAGATRPTQVRVMFAGASERLASALGYNPQDNAGNKFVKDDSMIDRFLLIKMPLGLDFYSYKYFNEIQKEYVDHRKDVLGDVYGCHIHKEFASVDLKKAVAKVQQNSLLSYVRPLYSAALIQTFLDLLKQQNKSLYDITWGEFTMPDMGFGSFAVNSDDPFALGAPSDDPFGGDVWGARVDKFLMEVIANQTSITIKINKFNIEDSHLVIEGQPNAIDITELRSFTTFLTSLVAADAMGDIKDLTSSINAFKDLVRSNEGLKREYESSFRQVAHDVLETPLFKLALTWRSAQNPNDVPYFNIIQEILNGRI